MKYYKLINQNGWENSFKLNRIYPANYAKRGFTQNIGDYATGTFRGDWEEVSEEEYLLQKNKTKRKPVIKKPYKAESEVTYHMITTHPYFRNLPVNKLAAIINQMDYDGFLQLQGHYSNEKASNLKASFEKEVPFTLPETWYVVVTTSNKDVLSKWRGADLHVGQITGMAKFYWGNGKPTKEHNPINSTENFGNEITFAQFKEYVLKTPVTEETTEETEFPSRWSIKGTDESRPVIVKWLDDNGWSGDEYSGGWTYFAFPNWENYKGFKKYSHTHDSMSDEEVVGYTEITLEQFKKHVLKESETKIPERISFYVRYTPEFTEDLYNSLMEWSRSNCNGVVRGYNDSYIGLQEGGFFLFDNYGLNYQSYNETPNKMSYGVDNNRQGCKEEFSVERVKEFINYVEPIKQKQMNVNEPKTFRIDGSTPLLEAMLKELEEVGYDTRLISEKVTVITHNQNTKSSMDTHEKFIELWGEIDYVKDRSEYDATFTLPKQYNEALQFAKEQFNISKNRTYKRRFKEGDIVVVLDNESGCNNESFYTVGRVGIIDKMYNQRYWKDKQYEWVHIEGCNENGIIDKHLRLATPEEIQKWEIIQEAKKRYPIGTKFIPAHVEPGDDYCIVLTDEFFFENGVDYLYAKFNGTATWDVSGNPEYGNTSFNRVVYKKGKWAEVYNLPAININGYIAEFTEDSVSFGCQTFSKETAYDLVRLLELGVINSPFEKELKQVSKTFKRNSNE